MIIKNNFNMFQYVLIVLRELLNIIEVHIKNINGLINTLKCVLKISADVTKDVIKYVELLVANTVSC
jgi:hypothetical protein